MAFSTLARTARGGQFNQRCEPWLTDDEESAEAEQASHAAIEVGTRTKAVACAGTKSFDERKLLALQLSSGHSPKAHFCYRRAAMKVHAAAVHVYALQLQGS